MKTFVYAAVAATIAASSAMASTTVLATTEAEWLGAVKAGDLGDASCVFSENTDGVMSYNSTNKAWTTTQAASVVMTQSGAVGVKVYPDLFARETILGAAMGAAETSNKAEGVAHAVNVSYNGELNGGAVPGAESTVEVLRQHQTDPGAEGNRWVLLSDTDDGTGTDTARGSVVYRAPSNTGDYMVNNNDAVADGVGAMLIAEKNVTLTNSAHEGNFGEGDLPVAMKINIAGTAALINQAEENLLKEGSMYGITHNIVCLQ